MTAESLDLEATPARSQSWIRLICVILFLATFLNYANRITFTQSPLEIQYTFKVDEAGFGTAEKYFSWGFAGGGLVFGVLSDMVSIRWLYPAVLLAWSLAGAAMGMVDDFDTFCSIRFLLGLFEAGHWPCALRLTQRTFLPQQRTFANGILQTGASVAQVVTPLLIVALNRWDPTHWRLSCWVVGAAGIPWVILWLASVRSSDVNRPVIGTDDSAAGAAGKVLQEVPFYELFLARRWWLLLLTVCCINTPWHFIRVWLPDTLQSDHGYSKDFVGYYTSIYAATNCLGSVLVGFLTERLSRAGWNVFRARLVAFLGCAILTACVVPAAFLPRGMLLLGMLLFVAVGSLGLFPIYYSLSQELSGKNQGKVGGSLAFCTWMLVGQMHGIVGSMVKEDPHIRPYIFAAVGLLPLFACAALALFWNRKPATETGDLT